MSRTQRSKLEAGIRELAVPTTGLTLRHGSASYSVEAALHTEGDLAALVLGTQTVLLTLDREAKTAAVRDPGDTAVLEEFAAVLLPPPTPPEVMAANEALASLPKLPRGYRYAVDERGQPSVVKEGEKPRRAAPKPTPSGPPELAKGATVRRQKDGHLYRVTGLDAKLGKAYFEPVEAGDPNLAAAYPASGFWRQFEAAG